MSKYNNIKNYPIYFKHIIKRVIFFLQLTIYSLAHPVQLKYILKFTGKSNDGINSIPWFTYSAINWTEKNIKKNMAVFEWGSGGSTLFLSSKVKELVSIEHNRDWYEKVSKKLKEIEATNCSYNLIENSSGSDEYVNSIEKYPNNYFDLIVVDSEVRNTCLAKAKDKTKPGGHIILDNSEREEYKEGMNFLSNWNRVHFYGPGPYNYYFWRTSIFKKPK